jgi:hypothetical protein
VGAGTATACSTRYQAVTDRIAGEPDRTAPLPQPG